MKRSKEERMSEEERGNDEERKKVRMRGGK